MQTIQDKDIEFVASLWPHYSKKANHDMFFRYLAQTFSSVAIYKDEKIVSWLLESLIGSFLHLFTVPEHRGKGLAAIVIQEMCKKIIVKGRTPFCAIVPGNITSERLFLRCGFKKWGEEPIDIIATQ